MTEQPCMISIESNSPELKKQLLKQLRQEYEYERDGNLFVYIGIHILNLVLLTSIFGRTIAITPIVSFYTAACIAYYLYNSGDAPRPVTSIGDRPIVFLEGPSYKEYVDENGQNIETLYHENSQKFAFAYYISTLFDHMTEYTKVVEQNPNSIIVMCGSLFTDFEIHMETLREFGFINEIEYKIYKKMYECAISSYIRDTYFIYISGGGGNGSAGEFQDYCDEKYSEFLRKNSPLAVISCNSTALLHETFSKEIVKNVIKIIRCAPCTETYMLA